MSVKMRDGTPQTASRGDGLTKLAQGEVRGAAVASLEKFTPGGMYLLLVYQETTSSGEATYQGIYYLVAPRASLFDSQDLASSVFGTAGSAAPTVTVGIGGVSIQPNNSSSTVRYVLLKMG